MNAADGAEEVSAVHRLSAYRLSLKPAIYTFPDAPGCAVPPGVSPAPSRTLSTSARLVPARTIPLQSAVAVPQQTGCHMVQRRGEPRVRFPRAEFPCMRGVSDCAESTGCSRLRTRWCCLRHAERPRHSGRDYFAVQYPACTFPVSASMAASPLATHDSGQDGSLRLSCMTLSFTTPRRLFPAHSAACYSAIAAQIKRRGLLVGHVILHVKSTRFDSPTATVQQKTVFQDGFSVCGHLEKLVYFF
jgi:hypothetical protein